MFTRDFLEKCYKDAKTAEERFAFAEALRWQQTAAFANSALAWTNILWMITLLNLVLWGVL